MNKIPNRQAICEVLMEKAETDKDIVVLCSDSRGSASLAPFAAKYPEQFVEVGIAEQDLVSISAGLAKCGKKPFAASPACFLSTRSYEQAKIDCAYFGYQCDSGGNQRRRQLWGVGNEPSFRAGYGSHVRNPKHAGLSAERSVPDGKAH